MDRSAKAPPKRRADRFRDGENLRALVAGAPALVFSESRTGCGVIMVPESAPKESEVVLVQIGNVGKARGRVRWRKDVDADVTKIGIEYI